MKTRHVLAAVVAGAMALGANGASAQVEKPKRPGPTRPVPPDGQQAKDGESGGAAIDIRAAVQRLRAQNKLKEGKNLVYTSAEGVKLWLVNTGGKVSAWQATDRNGKSLPVRYNRQSAAKGDVTCEVCVTIPGGTKVCYDVSCDNLPEPKKDATRK